MKSPDRPLDYSGSDVPIRFASNTCRVLLLFCFFMAIVISGARSADAQSFAYVANQNSANVSVISTASNSIST